MGAVGCRMGEKGKRVRGWDRLGEGIRCITLFRRSPYKQDANLQVKNKYCKVWAQAAVLKPHASSEQLGAIRAIARGHDDECGRTVGWPRLMALALYENMAAAHHG